jgi:SAM-dependent methyltransferase
MSFIPEPTRQHLDRMRQFYDQTAPELSWAARSYRSLLAHYYNLLIPSEASVLEIGCGSGELLALIQAGRKTGIDLSANQIATARRRLPAAEFHVQSGEELNLAGKFDYIIISDTLNLAADVQQLLEQLHAVSHDDTRLVINYYSSLWRPVLTLAGWFGLRSAQPQSSWISTSDIRNLLSLADWDPVFIQTRLLLPVRMGGLENIVNRFVAPLLAWFCLTVFCAARPIHHRARKQPTVSVIIPARNEAGNIEAAIHRTPKMGAGTELIFVEGNSTDNTWAEIQRVKAAYPDNDIKIMQQSGKGKGDAVRKGFAAATGDILMILDADLTMPPEELPKFYEVLARGQAEFANGVRLVYPMDKEAMQFLNLCANKTFGIIFTWLLGQPVKDTLCGTKVLSRAHYDQIAANRAYFGDFDPFGDFDLLFGAAKLNLKIVDVPIRYKDRTYGSTNIHRWSHGWLLLRMVVFAARKLKFI